MRDPLGTVFPTALLIHRADAGVVGVGTDAGTEHVDGGKCASILRSLISMNECVLRKVYLTLEWEDKREVVVHYPPIMRRVEGGVIEACSFLLK